MASPRLSLRLRQKETMKILMSIGVWFCVPFVLIAQTNYKTITVTNWVMPGPYLRIVNGNLYNTAYSTNWGHLLKEIGLSGNLWMNYSVKVAKVWPDRISCAVFKLTYKPETYTGQAQLDDTEFLEYIVIYNYPNSNSLISGQDLGDCLCMRVKNYITNGISFVALDCGIQATNPVAVISVKK
jgi:hypothetical protein